MLLITNININNNSIIFIKLLISKHKMYLSIFYKAKKVKFFLNIHKCIIEYTNKFQLKIEFVLKKHISNSFNQWQF